MKRLRWLNGRRHRKQQRRIIEHSVPCDGCVVCCQSDAVFIHPELGDRAADYQTEAYMGRLILAHKPNGDCVYLTATGCGIHARRPAICRELDCAIWLKHDPAYIAHLLTQGMLRPEIIAAAKARVRRAR